MNHSAVLAISYSLVCGLWLGLSRALPYWQHPVRCAFERPWRELGLALAAAVAVVGLGQLWSHGVRVPGGGPWEPFAESVNQLIIFSPILFLPVVRRQGQPSAWLPPDAALPRLGIGLGLALVALTLYAGLETGAPSWIATLSRVFRPRNAPYAVQVLAEDIALAVVVVRLAAALGAGRAILITAALFAAGHLPSLMSAGASGAELVGLVRDFGLTAIVLGSAWRGADVLWLWPVHFALDMTQFVRDAA
mgnify:FL=1